MLNATTVGVQPVEMRGVKGYTARLFSDAGRKQWPILIKNEGTAFEVDGTTPATIVLLRVFVVGANEAIGGECLCWTGRRGSCG